MPLGIPLSHGQLPRGCACGVPISVPQYMATPNQNVSGLGDARADFIAARNAFRANRSPATAAAVRSAFGQARTEWRTAHPGGGGPGYGGGGWGRRHHHHYGRHRGWGQRFGGWGGGGWGPQGWRGERFGSAAPGGTAAVTASAAPLATGLPDQSSPPLAVAAPGMAVSVLAPAPASASPIMPPSVPASWDSNAPVGPMGGLAGIVQDILVGIGIMDPIAHYEPELANNLPRVFGKEEDLVARYSVDIKGLRSGQGQREMFDRLSQLQRLVEDLRPAYTIEGSRPGSRERKKLGELVKGVWDFRHDFGLAKKKYGWNPVPALTEGGDVVASSPEPAVAPQVQAEGPGGIPWPLIAAGVAVALFASRK